MKYQIRREPNNFDPQIMMYRVYAKQPLALGWTYVHSFTSHEEARNSIVNPVTASEAVVEELEV